MSLEAVHQAIAKLAAQNDKTAEIVGRIGNKFGSFTEGLAGPAIRKVLFDKFGADVVTGSTYVRKGGESQEYDNLGISNGSRNQVVLVEIKSNLTADEVKKFERKFESFFRFMPEYRGKELVGLLVAVDMAKGIAAKVMKSGFYLMESDEENFTLCPPPAGFKPRVGHYQP